MLIKHTEEESAGTNARFGYLGKDAYIRLPLSMDIVSCSTLIFAFFSCVKPTLTSRLSLRDTLKML